MERKRFNTLKFGVGLLAFGTGPLLLVGLAAMLGIGDPNPNPIGLGLLAFVTFWPAVTMIIIGLFRARRS